MRREEPDTASPPMPMADIDPSRPVDEVVSERLAARTPPAALSRVLTYNVHSCIGADRKYDPHRILDIVRRIDADVVALQEVRAYSTTDDQFHLFEEHLRPMAAVFGTTFRRTRFKFGNALFVRGEILETRLLDLSVAPFEERGAIDCTVRVRGRRMRFIAAHLGLFRRERAEQLVRLAAALKLHREEITVLLGDFNIFGAERRRLRTVGAPVLLPRIRTFPSFQPIMSLDRIWTIPNDRLVRLARYRDSPAKWASDHLPLVGEVSLTA
ncbi:endonuclease/exonuclease/phosphatase family protein [Vineibacter terrae]|uniref:endonuclease/exonuclease/phosphatase family protein n=1 Tax=Vineibacter terrae TaxID=2586908 RepID=UPI002E35E1DD|nr:endonuclease/exonuclease/phosphatase family protein [Vineibacter terrae]HEX2890731.1 endonuclease/exonuclease/phosphatase family protein [Vineibacter terrae]